MNRFTLEWNGKAYAVESCATCPARDGSKCKVRGVHLRTLHAGRLFPSFGCPVYSNKPTVAPGSTAKPSRRGRINCCWCGNLVNPKDAVYVVGDKRDGHIYCRFECLEQDLRTNDK